MYEYIQNFIPTSNLVHSVHICTQMRCCSLFNKIKCEICTVRTFSCKKTPLQYYSLQQPLIPKFFCKVHFTVPDRQPKLLHETEAKVALALLRSGNYKKETRQHVCYFHFSKGPCKRTQHMLANNTQHCWAQQCCDLLRPFAWNHSNVGTCCVQFETGQTFARTSPNISIVLWPAKRSAYMEPQPWPRENVFARAL